MTDYIKEDKHFANPKEEKKDKKEEKMPEHVVHNHKADKGGFCKVCGKDMFRVKQIHVK